LIAEDADTDEQSDQHDSRQQRPHDAACYPRDDAARFLWRTHGSSMFLEKSGSHYGFREIGPDGLRRADACTAPTNANSTAKGLPEEARQAHEEHGFVFRFADAV